MMSVKPDSKSLKSKLRSPRVSLCEAPAVSDEATLQQVYAGRTRQSRHSVADDGSYTKARRPSTVAR